jgi:hypothetical protein
MAGGRDVDGEDIARLDEALNALELLRAPEEMVAAVSRIDAASSGMLAGPHLPGIYSKPTAVSGRLDID